MSGGPSAQWTLATDGLVVVPLHACILGETTTPDAIAIQIAKDIATSRNGCYHAQMFRTVRNLLHAQFVEDFAQQYASDPDTLVEQVLDQAVHIGDDGWEGALVPISPKAKDDTGFVGFVNFSSQDQTVTFVPGSHRDADLVVPTECCKLGKGEVSVTVPFGYIALMVDTLCHHAKMWSEDLDDSAWCLVVAWRMTCVGATANTSSEMADSLSEMFAKFDCPKRSSGDLASANAARRIKRKGGELEAVLPYTPDEMDLFSPRNEWAINGWKKPWRKEIKLF